MNVKPRALENIAQYLAEKLTTDRYPTEEQGGIVKVSDRPVYRLGLALEPFSTMTEWVEKKGVDALWLHRPWQLAPGALPDHIGVLYHHLPFDEHLTIGYITDLAGVLGMEQLQPIGFKQAVGPAGELLPRRPIGMVADVPEKPFAQWRQELESLFGGLDEAVAGRPEGFGRVAVIGAMNDDLVRDAAERGATLYLTGQYRASARKAVQETGIGVIAVGHHRSEIWGLQALQRLLQPLLDTRYKS